MTLAVAKNCKMTKKSDIDDVINTLKMSDISEITDSQIVDVLP